MSQNSLISSESFVLIDQTQMFRKAKITREATFFKVQVYIKANYPIAILQFALPQTILKFKRKSETSTRHVTKTIRNIQGAIISIFLHINY